MKKLLALLLSLTLVLTLFAACGNTDNANGDENVGGTLDEADNADTTEPITINIASLKGPTTMGMVKLMDDSDNGLTANNYNVAIYGTADEIVPKIVNGEIDIANVPANLASILYKKTEGKISVIDINTLGVLYVVETGETINSVADLKGKTIYSTGKGTTPEYTLNYILKSNGIDPATDVTIEFKSEATEVAAMLEGAENAVAVLPQPYVTVAMTKNANIRIALNLVEEYAAIDGSQMVTGVTIARNEFIEANPDALKLFMADYNASVEYVNANVDEAAALVGKYDIVAEGVAKKALPMCNIVYITGDEMKTNIETYLNVLLNSDPTSVGGALPDDSFYYIG
ncbi:MAG: ABC transporter substrate-binding protein [Oscillospiraceae bacterium]|nr:ABC transporter substrate-binding protein [Oscillospiraceae bacterium]